MSIIERLKRRYSSLDNIKRKKLSRMQELTEYLQPERANFFGGDTQSAEDRIKIFDSTPEDAAEELKAHLHANCASPVHKFFGIELDDDGAEESDEEKEWLDIVDSRMAAKFNDEQTNFHTAVDEFFLDYVTYGIAGFFVKNPEKGVIKCLAEPPSNIRIAENADGEIDTIYRDFNWSARQIYETWPKKCSQKVKEAYEKNPDQTFKVIHAIEPRKKFKEDAVRGKDMRIGSYYFLEDCDELLEESGFQEDAYFVVRFGKRSNDPWGTGPGHKALPDIRVLNEIERSGLIATEKAADPTTYLPHDGFIGNHDSSGGALNFHRITGDIRDRILTIGSDADLNAIEAKAAQKRSAIRKIFLNDKIIPMEKEMTATEYVGNFEANMRILGPTYGRLKSDFLQKLIARFFGIMLRDGLLPPPPESLKGKRLKVKYISPIERSQKKIEAQAFSEALQHLMPLGQALPQVGQAMARHIDVDFLVRNTQPIFGYPAKNLKSLDKIKKEDQARAEAEAQQAEAAKRAQELELAGKANEVRNGQAGQQQ